VNLLHKIPEINAQHYVRIILKYGGKHLLLDFARTSRHFKMITEFILTRKFQDQSC